MKDLPDEAFLDMFRPEEGDPSTFPPETPCICPEPGYCPRFKIKQQRYPWEVCQGIGCPPEKSLSMRKKWAGRVSKPSEAIRKDGEVSLPARATLLANAARAAARNLGRLLRGQGLYAPTEVIEARQALCKSNQCGYFRESDNRCAHGGCGCYLGERLTLGVLKVPGKTSLAAEACPEGFWGPVLPPEEEPSTEQEPTQG